MSKTNINDLRIGEIVFWVTQKEYAVKSGELEEISVTKKGKRFFIRSNSKWESSPFWIEDCWLSHSEEEARMFSVECEMRDIKQNVLAQCKRLKKLRENYKEIKSMRLIKQLAGLPEC